MPHMLQRLSSTSYFSNTGALMPKPRVLEKYEVDESRCILCGICVDACPYDALRCGPDFELAHESRAEPMIDLMAISAIERDTEVSYVRRERDWLARAQAEGRDVAAEPAAADAAAGRRRRHGHGRRQRPRPAGRWPGGHLHAPASCGRAHGASPQTDPVPRLALGRPALPGARRRACSAAR